MSCPRCGFADAQDPSCPRCGVIFSKLGQERPRPAPRPSRELADDSPATASPASLVGYVLLGLAALAAGALWLRSPPPAAPPPRADASTAVPPPLDAAPPRDPSTLTVPTAVAPALPGDGARPGGTVAEDQKAFDGLAARISSRTATAADVEAGVALQVRYPTEPAFERLVTELMLSVAFVHLEGRRFPEAVAMLRRAAALPWAEPRARQALLAALLAASDWNGLEAYANQLLSTDPGNAEAWYALGYALFKLDRNRESAEALRRCLAIKNDDRAQSLLARIDRTSEDERGMTEQNLSHFHVRYDGEEHVEVGREIVTALERHYATLVIALDHRPERAIPVILFSRERYHEAAGAPIWSGGAYDSLDGRIRVPIGGLTRSLTSGLDGTLMHELTHAFVADKSRGIAPRDVHEGLAQYMEGDRLSAAQREALARGRIGGVHGFYLGALGFVEHLVGQRGPGGINDLIQAMGETGSVNEAFRKVYGQDHDAMLKAWARRLEQQHGS